MIKYRVGSQGRRRFPQPEGCENGGGIYLTICEKNVFTDSRMYIFHAPDYFMQVMNNLQNITEYIGLQPMN